MGEHSGKYVALLPGPSIEKQGVSGLGLEAQKAQVATYIDGRTWSLAAEYVEYARPSRASSDRG
jgi:hypothetical protein